jgi:hypothetical protein
MKESFRRTCDKTLDMLLLLLLLLVMVVAAGSCRCGFEL